MVRTWERLYLHEKPVSHTSVPTACSSPPAWTAASLPGLLPPIGLAQLWSPRDDLSPSGSHAVWP